MKKILSIIIANILLLGCMQAFATTEEMQAWKYSGEFHLSDTADIIKDNGIYFSNSSSVDFYEGYALLTNGNEKLTIDLGKKFAGDYTFEAITQISSGSSFISVNNSDNSFYKIQLLNGKLVLSKIVNGETSVLAENAFSGNSTDKLTFVYSQKLLDNGISINASVKSETADTTVDYTDTINAFEKGIAKIAFENSPSAKVYSVNAYSTPSNQQYYKNKTLIDISDWRGENFDSLAKKGLVIDKMKLLKAYSDNLELINNGGNATFAPVGSEVINGSYTAEFALRWNYNKPGARFNYNGTSYYDIVKEVNTVDSVKSYDFKINKVTSSGTQTIATTSFTADIIKDTYSDRTYKIDVDKSVSPARISVVISDSTGSVTLSGEDSSPLPDGKVQLRFSSVGQPRLLSFKCINKQAYGGVCEDGDAGTYINPDGKLICLEDDLFFYVNDVHTDTYSKGKIQIEAPVKRLGSYVVIAVLYEDYAMTGIKVLSPEDLYNGKVELFDTSSSQAVNSGVKVFIFDREDTLNSRTGIFELN